MKILNSILFSLTFLSSSLSFACSCECKNDCSFSIIASESDFVALVKVIEYPDYLDKKIIGYNQKMPFSMIVEVIEKYKGSEKRKRIKIWGDNGALCRPYISQFEIGSYYVIAPNKINSELEKLNNDYDFFSCNTDYLKVNFENKTAHGEYTKKKT